MSTFVHTTFVRVRSRRDLRYGIGPGEGRRGREARMSSDPAAEREEKFLV